MAFFTKADMRSRCNRILAEQQRLGKSMRTILAELPLLTLRKPTMFFCLTAAATKLLVLGVKGRLEDEGLSVYIDWIDDADLDRAAVTPENAKRLRRRMRQCLSLLYIGTDNASRSKWMPWEVGFFDGLGKEPWSVRRRKLRLVEKRIRAKPENAATRPGRESGWP
jgi:hypothetical protein